MMSWKDFKWFRKETLTDIRECYVCTLFGVDIPLRAITDFVKTMFLVVMIFFAFNFGHVVSLWYVDFLKEPTVHCDPRHDQCTVCVPTTEGNQITLDWRCKTINNMDIGGVNPEDLRHDNFDYGGMFPAQNDTKKVEVG
jgi:hypothetical protein